MKQRLLYYFLVTGIFSFIGCSKNDNNPVNPDNNNPITVTLTISPTSVTIFTGGSLQFKATVTGSTNTTVTWAVVSGGGTMTNAGLYSAPATITSDSVTAIIKATANADTRVTAQATIRVKKASSSGEKAAIKAGYGGSQLVHELGTSSASLCAEAAFLASQLGSGGTMLITTGTLTQSAPNSQTFTYASSPGDRLRIQWANATVTEFIITKLNGDLTGDAENFLKNSHELEFRITVSGSVNMQIYSLQNNGAVQASAAGTFVYEGITYTANLTEQGTFTSSVDPSFVETTTNLKTNGTITASDFSLTVDETYWSYTLYNASQNKLVQNIIRTSSNAWTASGSNYRLTNCEIKKAFINQRPGDIDSYWNASGTLLRNETAFGQMGEAVSGAQIKIWLDIPGDRIELEAYVL